MHSCKPPFDSNKHAYFNKHTFTSKIWHMHSTLRLLLAIMFYDIPILQVINLVLKLEREEHLQLSRKMLDNISPDTSANHLLAQESLAWKLGEWICPDKGKNILLKKQRIIQEFRTSFPLNCSNLPIPIPLLSLWIPLQSV